MPFGLNVRWTPLRWANCTYPPTQSSQNPSSTVRAIMRVDAGPWVRSWGEPGCGGGTRGNGPLGVLGAVLGAVLGGAGSEGSPGGTVSDSVGPGEGFSALQPASVAARPTDSSPTKVRRSCSRPGQLTRGRYVAGPRAGDVGSATLQRWSLTVIVLVSTAPQPACALPHPSILTSPNSFSATRLYENSCH